MKLTQQQLQALTNRILRNIEVAKDDALNKALQEQSPEIATKVSELLATLNNIPQVVSLTLANGVVVNLKVNKSVEIQTHRTSYWRTSDYLQLNDSVEVAVQRILKAAATASNHQTSSTLRQDIQDELVLRSIEAETVDSLIDQITKKFVPA